MAIGIIFYTITKTTNLTTAREIIIGLTIHLLVPMLGLIYFVLLTKKMRKENLSKSTTYEIFAIFINYGGLVLVTLTTFFWKWSGLSSLGIFYLILIAPIVMGIIAFKNNKYKDKSIYYNRIYKAGVLYYVIAPLTFFILIFTG
ncbi:MAG: hypothetical protein RO257_07120 [Candidatus Kapabacteria bacterium]|nr:hypothetical protein [Candidatus Kapabacteria bacterium]